MSNIKMECSQLDDSVSHLRKLKKRTWLAQTSAKLN